MTTAHQNICFQLNGVETRVTARPIDRLADLLREDLGLTGTKIGCNAGDCGACTVLLDGKQVCACLIAAGQIAGRRVETIESLTPAEPDSAAVPDKLSALQDAFLRHGAAQCGICTPGMLMAAQDLLHHNQQPTEAEVQDALGGVLCRCTGYRKIIDAVLDIAGSNRTTSVDENPQSGAAVGARLPRVDGIAKVTGSDIFGADQAPADALWLRAVRSPHARARFSVGDLAPLYKAWPGLVRVLNWQDVPGNNSFGIYPVGKDQPVLARDHVRYRGEAILALVGDRQTINSIRDEDLPIVWDPETPVLSIDDGLSDGAARVQEDKPGNILIKGRVCKGDIDAAFARAAYRASGDWQTSYVEHAYIEPEAGWAIRRDDRIEITVSTQTPYMDRDEIAHVMGLDAAQVRIIPTACGGGFGGKLDLSVQPLVAVAAWLLDRPVRCVYSRPESMAASTKRHPSRVKAEAACDADGRLIAYRSHGDFNTGAYASWGPTVADRVPIHATGPYYVETVKNTSTAVHTNGPPSGAFRGFGVPQAAIAHEDLYDSLAEQAGLDPLEFRLINAIRVGQPTATGQVLDASAGLADCLEALKPYWTKARQEAEHFNKKASGQQANAAHRRGVGIACMWYGCGNTSMSNPSTMRVGLRADGTLTLYNGAADIGQGSNTIMIQICADALGVPAGLFSYVTADTDRTADAGKSSASRQTFVSGKAAALAGQDLRAQILRRANVSHDASIDISDGQLMVHEGDAARVLDLSDLTADQNGDVLFGEGTFDPPTAPLDDDGQGTPYATYGFAAQMAEVEIDTALGTLKVTRIVAAHDVGRAINPTQVEGQIHGGIAQGLGLALMEEYLPGRTENLHDYLIPTIGDIPPIVTLLIEDAEPLGPFGAKGIGEPALIPTAPAIFGAVRHATGVSLRHAPATPDRVLTALRQGGFSPSPLVDTTAEQSASTTGRQSHA